MVGWFPLVVIGSATLLAGMVSLLLPETLGAGMPDTIEEAERRSCVARGMINTRKRKAEQEQRLNVAQSEHV